MVIAAMGRRGREFGEMAAKSSADISLSLSSSPRTLLKRLFSSKYAVISWLAFQPPEIRSYHFIVRIEH